MQDGEARVALAPFLSSPSWLCAAGFFVTLAAYLIQLRSGVSPWFDLAPIEISSNIVALMALVWAIIELRTFWTERERKRSWALFACAFALLSIEGSVGDGLSLETQSLQEMSISIVMWLVAAALIAKGVRAYAARRYVVKFVLIGFVLQLISQALGLAAALSIGSASVPVDTLKVLNDTGELVAVLAYLFALLLAEFAPSKSWGFGMMLDPNRRAGPEARSAWTVPGEVINLDRFRNRRRD